MKSRNTDGQEYHVQIKVIPRTYQLILLHIIFIAINLLDTFLCQGIFTFQLPFLKFRQVTSFSSTIHFLIIHLLSHSFSYQFAPPHIHMHNNYSLFSSSMLHIHMIKQFLEICGMNEHILKEITKQVIVQFHTYNNYIDRNNIWICTITQHK